ncbi:class III lanthipeptide [Actinosynnema sp. NPDC020468]
MSILKLQTLEPTFTGSADSLSITSSNHHCCGSNEPPPPNPK